MKDSDVIKAYVLILIGFAIIFATSIWLGFPSPHYNRWAISITLYIFSILIITIGTIALIKK